MNRYRHYGGFLLAGVSALTTDAVVLTVLHRGMDIDPLLARLPAIIMAMVVSWLINRAITFAVTTRPSLREFLKFAAVSWVAQVVNYCVFAVILFIAPAVPPVVALVGASLVAMFVAYAGFRFGVFRNTGI